MLVMFLAMHSSRLISSRFGKIIFIDSYAKVAHLQYYQHSSQTMLQEISDPQELFLTETCGAIQLNSILSKIVVHSGIFRVQSSTKLDVLDFFCKKVVFLPKTYTIVPNCVSLACFTTSRKVPSFRLPTIRRFSPKIPRTTVLSVSNPSRRKMKPIPLGLLTERDFLSWARIIILKTLF